MVRHLIPGPRSDQPRSQPNGPDPGPAPSPMSLRWALTHMIAGYAAHAAQADLIRDRIDGRKGW